MADSFDILKIPADEAARRLLGCELVRELNGQSLVCKIVETEAYDQTDAASHSYRGKTPRTEVMFGAAGHLYVYFTYGMHYCMNVVVGQIGYGAAVLIRAVEPLSGEAAMTKNRPGQTGAALTNGPAKLCRALAVDRSLSGHNLHRQPLRLIIKSPLLQAGIVQATRIGISRAQDVPWRFYIRGNKYVSSPLKIGLENKFGLA